MRPGATAWRALALVLFLPLGSCGPKEAGAPPVHVAAAADLARAFPQVAEVFTRATGSEVVFSFGSSGLLARQLAEGGPWDAFASADEGYLDRAIASGACTAGSRARYASGRLVIWRRAPLDHLPLGGLAGLAGPGFRRLAIAQPEHAPYGRAAREALRGAGVWDAVAPRIVYGENVQRALQFAASGNVDAALVARSLVTEGQGEWVQIPPDAHGALDQGIAPCRGGRNAEGGAAWVRFVVSPEAQAILRAHGFDPPR